MEQLLCPWESSTYLFFSSNVPDLIYYSHATAIIAALGMGILIFANNPKGAIQRLFLLFTFLFSFWVVLDVVLWATNRPDVVMLFWSLQILLEPLTYATAFYLYYYFLHQRWPGFRINVFITMLLVPLILFLPTPLNLEALALSSCEAIEGPLAKYYTYIVHSILMIGIVVVAFRRIPKLATKKEKFTGFFFGTGLIVFLLAFSSGNIISSFTDDWVISQYGLFGMPVFVGFIAYSIVKFQAFNIKLFATQVLVVAITALIGTRLFYSTTTTGTILSIITLIGFLISGFFLIRSVKREIEQREHIEKLAKDLEISNEQLSEFMSLATHEIRNPATFIKGFSAGALEGDLGELTPAVKDGMQKIFIRANDIIHLGNQYLNKSKIELGQLKYEFAPVELGKLVADLAHEFEPAASQQSITITADIDKSQQYIVNADSGKIKEVVGNLIDNSIKYTKQGSVTVSISKDEKTVTVKIMDTGAGIPAEVIPQLFKKFSRADAEKANILGTGLGLYLAKTFVDAHHGRIWVESEGKDKGSTFFVTIPLSTA